MPTWKLTKENFLLSFKLSTSKREMIGETGHWWAIADDIQCWWMQKQDSKQMWHILGKPTLGVD